MSDRVFKLESPYMKGDDVRAWQRFLYEDFRSRWSIEYPLDIDGDYGEATRAATASFLRAWGMESAQAAMEHGVTPELRIKIRNSDRTNTEQNLAVSDERKAYRAALRDRFAHQDVCYPVPNLVTDAWGWHPGVHDGVDLVCPWKQPLLAICTGVIVRVSPSGWWGVNPQASPGHPISDGDGIVILACDIDDGPFVVGLHFGYGHAELAAVGTGERVKAGAGDRSRRLRPRRAHPLHGQQRPAGQRLLSRRTATAIRPRTSPTPASTDERARGCSQALGRGWHRRRSATSSARRRRSRRPTRAGLDESTPPRRHLPATPCGVHVRHDRGRMAALGSQLERKCMMAVVKSNPDRRDCRRLAQGSLARRRAGIGLGVVLCVLDLLGAIDVDDELWIALLGAGGGVGVLGWSRLRAALQRAKDVR
jgi:hypothetical protein